ncbi:MAG: hypothetical protein MJB14_05500 [Spirochaetes bacterium]|nr:hypothetical protein [Spirochaetota bacterium]
MKNKVYITYCDSVSVAGLSSTEGISYLSAGEQKFTYPSENEQINHPYFRIQSLEQKYPFRSADIIFLLMNRLKEKGKAFPLFFATSTGNIAETENVYQALKNQKSDFPLLNSHFFGQITKDIKNKYPFISETITFSTACSSAGHALLQAFRFMQAGFIKKACILAVDVISLTTSIGFDSLRLVSPTGTKPLSKDRNGLSLGEGGGLIILESEPGTDPLAEVLSLSSNSDGYHISSPDPQGSSQKQCISNAIEQAGIQKEEIDYVNAHGTGTVMNDEIELKVLQSIFSHSFTISSLKSFIGHTLGASALIELALAIEMLKTQQIFQIKNFQNPMDSELIPANMIKKRVNYFIKNSFGFGGNNISMVVKQLV